MRPTLTPPDGVTVTQTLDTLHITFPGGISVKETATTQPRASRRTAYALVLGGVLVPLFLAWLSYYFGGGFPLIETEQLPLLLLTAVLSVSSITYAVLSLRKTSVSVDRKTETIVEIRPHTLRIQAGYEEEIPLESIERVTIDRAGARIRVDGRTRYLLRGRSRAERDWLAGLLKVRIAAQGSADTAEAHAARASLEKLLQTTRR